jgi:hypothetical protein
MLRAMNHNNSFSSMRRYTIHQIIGSKTLLSKIFYDANGNPRNMSKSGISMKKKREIIGEVL